MDWVNSATEEEASERGFQNMEGRTPPYSYAPFWCFYATSNDHCSSGLLALSSFH